MQPKFLPEGDLDRAPARWALGLVVLAAAMVYLWGIRWGLPPDWLSWAGDEILPGAVTQPAQWEPLYPPAHRYLLRALFDSLATFTEFVGRQVEDVRTFQTLAARGLTVAMATLSLFAIYRTGRLVYGRVESLAAVASVAFGTAYVYYGKTANLDLPYLFWFAVSLVFFLRCLRSRQLPEYALFAAFGALSIATKTQAWALYPLPAAALVLDLARSKRGQRYAFARSLVDRRILTAAGVTAFLTLLLFGELWGSGELGAHYRAITERPYESYRAAASTLSTTVELTRDNLLLNLGLPVLLCSMIGLLLALLRPQRNARLLCLLLFPLSYYPAFILATGFNYERHYLPITVILGLYAGKALGAVWRSPLLPRWLAAALVSIVLLHAMARGVSVDLLLRGDARYATERWIAAEGLTDRTAGLGSIRNLPRGIVAHSEKHFATWRRGEHQTNPVVWHNCFTLNRLGFEYLIPDFAERLAGPGVNYAEHRRFRSQARWTAVDFASFSSYHTTLAKLARDVVVFKRTGAECVDSGRVPRGLHELRYQRDPERRRSLARGILASPASKALTMPGSDYRVVRTHDNFWTVGSFPAGVVVANESNEPYAPKIGLSLGPVGIGAGSELEERPVFPITVSVEDGSATREVVFEGPAFHRIELPPLAPGDIGLYIVWSNTDWLGPGTRRLGVLLLPGETRGEWLDRLFDQVADPAVFETLTALASRGKRPHRARFIEAVLAGDVQGTIELSSGVANLVGGWHDGWTHGARPAGLVLRNPSSSRARPRIRVACDLAPGDPHLVLTVHDGTRADTISLDCVQPRSLKLRPVEANSNRLYVLSVDRPSRPTAQDGRTRGVEIRNVRMVAKPAAR